MPDLNLSPSTTLSKQSGFTMLELVIVVAIMAIVAGSAIMSFGNTASDAQLQTTRYSMKQIAQAVEAFYSDTRINADHSSVRLSPADLGFLFDASVAGATPWNPDYRQGWRGPYLKQAQYMYVDIGDDLLTNGSSDTVISEPGDPANGSEISNVLALPDAFDHSPDSNDFFEWQQRLNPSALDADLDTLDIMGRPFLVLDLAYLNSNKSGFGIPRIVSLGPNGIYEPVDCDYSSDTSCTRNELCHSSGDDLVLCLR